MVYNSKFYEAAIAMIGEVLTGILIFPLLAPFKGVPSMAGIRRAVRVVADHCGAQRPGEVFQWRII